MIARKLISRKVRGPTRSQNGSQALVWVYRERCVTLYVNGRDSHRISFAYIKRGIVHEGAHCLN